MKVTVPEGKVVEELTVAVNLINWPNFEGFDEETNAVVEAAFPTVSEIVPELLADWVSPL
jgi:hypothetical protein